MLAFLFSYYFQVNVIGTFNVVQRALETFALKNKDSSGHRGVIINTASTAAFDGQVGQVVSKFLRAWDKHLNYVLI